jgi:shikimate dehydrogenase
LHVGHPFYAFGLIGYPLGHSRSPKIHQAALASLGLKGEYHLYPVPPDSTGLVVLKRLLVRMRAGDIHGLNVTIPHKRRLIRFLDDLTPTASAIGAVNTLSLDDGKLVGDNTDVPGFWFDLCRQLGVGEVNADVSALILGAGGASRAVAYALLRAGFSITIAARRTEQAEEILCQFPDFQGRISILPLRSLGTFSGKQALIVNATPVGMQPESAESPWPRDGPFPDNAVVYDLVYNPIETRLVREARQAGRKAVSGLGMLVEQAALSFERWTGLPAPREVMMEAAYE